MDIKNDVINAISETTGMADVDSSMDVTLKNLGISSIEFFKIILALSKKVKIDLQEVDPEKVTVNMTPQNMIDYFFDAVPI